MDRQTQKLLLDALKAVEEILEYAHGVDPQEFSPDRMRQQATYYAFAILGEALNKLMKQSPSLRDEITDVRMSIDMRNRLIHGYSSVDLGVVWATVQADIPNLPDDLQALFDLEEPTQ